MNHDQDVGYSAAPGGGIGVLRDFKTHSPTGRNLLAGVTIENGPRRGLDISTARGSFNSFDLSFGSRQIVFAWSRRGENPWDTWTPSLDLLSRRSRSASSTRQLSAAALDTHSQALGRRPGAAAMGRVQYSRGS